MTHDEQNLLIYGFGSAFNNVTIVRDIDLLILHTDIKQASCRFAILCKRYLIQHINHAHITMLSKREEQELKFIKTSQAKLLGSVNTSYIENDLLFIINRIRIKQ